MRHRILRPAVFLDRDGTINVNTHYVNRPEDVRLLPHAAEGLRILRSLGFLLVVVTNQSGIARGYFTVRDLERVNRRLRDLLRAEGVELDAVHYSPYHKDGTVRRYAKESDCRKPGPGMLLKASHELGIDLASSYMVGDSDSDIGAGINAGVRASLLIGEPSPDHRFTPSACVKDLLEAAVWIGLDLKRRKIVPREELAERIRELRRTRRTLVFTNGAFDILHPGHLHFLRFCRGLGDGLVVGVNSDASVRAYKGPDRPVNPLDQRLDMLCGLDCVDLVTPFDEPDPRPLLRIVRPDIHVKDADYNPGQLVEAATVRRLGGRIVLIPRIGGYSTTAVLRRLRPPSERTTTRHAHQDRN